MIENNFHLTFFLIFWVQYFELNCSSSVLYMVGIEHNQLYIFILIFKVFILYPGKTYFFNCGRFQLHFEMRLGLKPPKTPLF
jgi:hypothetical protein